MNVTAERQHADAQLRKLMMRAQIESDPMDSDLDAAIVSAADLPFVRVPLLNVAVVRAATIDQGVSASIDRLEAEATEHHMSAMQAIAILHRVLLTSELGLGSTSFERLVEAQVLLEDDSQPPSSRCSGFIMLATTYGRLRLYELHDVALGEALAVLERDDTGAEGRSLCLVNQANVSIWHAFDAMEVGEVEVADDALRRCDECIEMVQWDLLPVTWRNDLTIRREIARATRHDRFVDVPPPSRADLEPDKYDEVTVLHQLLTAPTAWTTPPDLSVVAPNRSTVAHFLNARASRRDLPATPASTASDAHAQVLARELWNIRLASSSAIGARLEARRMLAEHASLRHETLTDPLTGLANRRRFDAAIERNLGAKAGLLSIDLDRFKRVNDTFGHRAGDEVLRRVAAAIAEAVGVDLRKAHGGSADDDHLAPLVARVGGDEFAVLLLADDRVNAEAMAQRVEDALSSLEWSDLIGDWSQHASVGVARGSCGEDLIGSADRNLYDRKSRQTR